MPALTERIESAGSGNWGRVPFFACRDLPTLDDADLRQSGVSFEGVLWPKPFQPQTCNETYLYAEGSCPRTLAGVPWKEMARDHCDVPVQHPCNRTWPDEEFVMEQHMWRVLGSFA